MEFINDDIEGRRSDSIIAHKAKKNDNDRETLTRPQEMGSNSKMKLVRMIIEETCFRGGKKKNL